MRARMNMNKCLSVQPIRVSQGIASSSEDYLDTELGYGEVTISDQREEKEVTKQIRHKIDSKIDSAVRDGIVDQNQGGPPS